MIEPTNKLSLIRSKNKPTRKKGSKKMRQICLLIQWVTKGKVCLGHCRQGLCKKTKSKI